MKDTISFFRHLKEMLEARYPILYLETAEFERVYRQLLGISEKTSYTLFSWNRVDHLRKLGISNGKQTIARAGDNLEDPVALMQEIENRIQNKENEIFVLEGIHDFIEEVEIKIWLRKFSEELKFSEGRKHIILLSPVRCLPRELEKSITLLELPLPGREELNKVLRQVANDGGVKIENQLESKMVDAAMGMTEQEADLAFCLSYSKTKLKHGADTVIMREKEQIIKKSGILEYFHHQEELKDVGGLKNLKDWLEKRGMAFSPGARRFHLAEPKGIMLLGLPGCGKSLTAKAVASLWSMPLLRLDIGKVFEGVVGSSESNVRSAIRTAEAVAPCVLWIDEIEKGLAGTGSSGSTDSGVTSRVFSTLLTWMQEKSHPVFVVATANGIEDLPPELLRKGRFDGIFFVDLPTQEERKDIFRIHLKKKEQSMDAASLDVLAKRTIGFNGAEIAEVVNDAMFAAYAENPREPGLKMKHLTEAISGTVTLSRTMRERIEFLRDWAANRAIPAGTGKPESLPEVEVRLAPQEVKRNRRLNDND